MNLMSWYIKSGSNIDYGGVVENRSKGDNWKLEEWFGN